MRINLPFRSAPSTEFTQPHLDGLQHVWKRICEHVIDRGDTYKREAFGGMHDESKIIDPEKYADLRVSHDTLSFERDSLMEAVVDPSRLAAELISKAYAYKSRAKLLYKNVLKALETAETRSSLPLSPPNTLGMYRFPSPSISSRANLSAQSHDLDTLKSRL